MMISVSFPHSSTTKSPKLSDKTGLKKLMARSEDLGTICLTTNQWH